MCVLLLFRNDIYIYTLYNITLYYTLKPLLFVLHGQSGLARYARTNEFPFIIILYMQYTYNSTPAFIHGCSFCETWTTFTLQLCPLQLQPFRIVTVHYQLLLLLSSSSSLYYYYNVIYPQLVFTGILKRGESMVEDGRMTGESTYSVRLCLEYIIILHTHSILFCSKIYAS